MASIRPQMFPALRSKMGDWTYYVSTMTFEDAARWVRKADEVKERKDFKSWIQREIQGKRVQQLATYLQKQDQHFFSAVVVGIFGGDPNWFPVDVGDNLSRPELQPGGRETSAFGLLLLSGHEQIFAIDGQHRVEGIKLAIKQRPALKKEELCVIFVGHRKNRDGHIRSRRLFFTLNRYAKPVSTADLIALSEDDAYACATRRLTEEFVGLDEMRVVKASGANIPITDATAFTTLVALYNSLVIIAKPRSSAGHSHLKNGPVTAEETDEVFKKGRRFWKSLRANIPEIKQLFVSRNPGRIVRRLRRPRGGHVLFRPLGLRCFTSAARIMIDRGMSLSEAVAQLSRVSLKLELVPWKNGVLWNQHTGHMAETKNAKLVTNLFLYLCEQPLSPLTFDLRGEYRDASGDQAAELP